MNNPICPSCGSPNVEQIDVDKYQCPYCGKTFSFRDSVISQQAQQNQESESKPTKNKGKIVMKNLGCLVGTVLFCTGMFISSYQKKGPDDAYDTLAGAIVICLLLYVFYFYKRINKK